MKQTTLNAIKRHKPCKDGWATLLKYLGKTVPDDEPLSLRTIYDSNGLDDALWCLRALDDTYLIDIQRLALQFARSVQHLMTDQRSIDALDVVERYLDGKATSDELQRAALAADAAVDDVHAAYAAVDASYAAADAASDAVYVARVARTGNAARAANAADVERIFLEFC